MKLLINNAIVCDPQSAWHGKKCAVTVIAEKITQIKTATPSTKITGYKIIDAKGAYLIPGLFDMRANLCEPGFEHKETLASAAKAALYGGFTHVAALPSTKPVTQTKAQIQYVLNQAEQLPIHILPYGATTKNMQGEELNELYDMHQAGAIAFTDGNNSIMHTGVMMRALLYSKIFNGLILTHAEDTHLSTGGMMNEGNVSVNLGLKGVANIAEEMMVARDIELAAYNQAPIHISHISTKGSVELIRKAKKRKIAITCDVAVAHLVYTHNLLETFDSNYKINPPLRTDVDKKALWDGIADGTIDCIVTDHKPESVEDKTVEFGYAATGITMLQTALSLLQMNKPNNILFDKVISALTANPRRVLKQNAVIIGVNEAADFCLFNPNENWVLNNKTNQSKSNNNPELNNTLTGKITTVITKNQLHLI